MQNLPNELMPAENEVAGSQFGMTPAQKATLSTSPDALLQWVLRDRGQDTPSQRAMYQQAMQAMPTLYLIDNFADMPIDPSLLQDGDREAAISAIFSNSLSSDSALNYAKQFVQNQDTTGVDPNAALRSLFTAGAVPNGDIGGASNIIQLLSGSGQAQDQINYVKNAVASSLVNANPIMQNVIAQLLDVLGTQYLSEGGSGGGFLDWLTKNSMLGKYVGEK